MEHDDELILDNHVFQKDEAVISVSEVEVVRLFSPHSNTMTELLGSGPEVWSCIDGKRSIGDIVAILLDSYEVNAEVLATDVKNFVRELVKRKMCRRVG